MRAVGLLSARKRHHGQETSPPHHGPFQAYGKWVYLAVSVQFQKASLADVRGVSFWLPVSTKASRRCLGRLGNAYHEVGVMLWKVLIATTSAVGIMTTDVMAQSSVPNWDTHTDHRVLQNRNVAGQELLPGYRSGVSEYDGPVYNSFGQTIGRYRGPVLGYSSSCNISTPGGYLYICQNFTW